MRLEKVKVPVDSPPAAMRAASFQPVLILDVHGTCGDEGAEFSLWIAAATLFVNFWR